jgi:hypothetical protein
MYCNIENYVLQHRKIYIATSKNMYCNISNSSTTTSQKSTMKHGNRKKIKNHLLQQPKNLISTFENHLLQHKKNPLQHGETTKRTYKIARGWV